MKLSGCGAWVDEGCWREEDAEKCRLNLVVLGEQDLDFRGRQTSTAQRWRGSGEEGAVKLSKPAVEKPLAVHRLHPLLLPSVQTQRSRPAYP